MRAEVGRAQVDLPDIAETGVVAADVGQPDIQNGHRVHRGPAGKQPRQLVADVAQA